MHMNIEHALREKLDVVEYKYTAPYLMRIFIVRNIPIGTLNWWVIVENPRIESTCCDESHVGLYIFLVWRGLDSSLFSVTYFYFLLSGCINLTGLVTSYEFLSFIQLAYRWLRTYCALVLLILSRMKHQVPYDTLVLICDWWLGAFNYLEKKMHRVSTLSGRYNWNDLMPNEAKKNVPWCFEKMPYVENLVQSSVANSNVLKLSLDLLAIT